MRRRLLPTPVRVASPALLVLGGLVFVAASPAVPAASQRPSITIAPDARLYVATAAPASGRAVAWVLFRTARPINARLTVVRVGDVSGRSYAASGASNCIRSAILDQPRPRGFIVGTHYRVSFYSRASIGGHSARRLVATRQLKAFGFDQNFPPPHCRLPT